MYALELAHLEQEIEVELFSGLPAVLKPQEREKEKQQRRKTKFSCKLVIVSHFKITKQPIYTCNYHNSTLKV